jgi:hypothetical protein
MIDIEYLGVMFRGFPVTDVSERVMAMLRDSGRDLEGELARILREAKEPDESVDWLFKSRIGTVDVRVELIQRFDGRPARYPGHGQYRISLVSER